MRWGRDPRVKAAEKATGALADFYRVPAPDAATELAELPLLAVDVETTGLNPRTDRLLSVGWVPVDGRSVSLAGATETVIADQAGPAGVGESATLHGLTDDELAGGVPAQEALTALLDAMSGRVLLAHFADIESGFLSVACRRLFGARLEVPVVDTLELERRHMERMATLPRGEDLRLPRVRARYGLPDYRSHRAVTDALACAELYLALTEPEEGRAEYRTLGSLDM
jgi:DNA polymerase-3 subunit epsilon